MAHMRVKSVKIVGTTIALLALIWISIIGVGAQQTADNSTSSGMTTNWMGYLVLGGYLGAGQLSPVDPMPGTAMAPTTVRQVQIGLRSDGLVVWREAGRPK